MILYPVGLKSLLSSCFFCDPGHGQICHLLISVKCIILVPVFQYILVKLEFAHITLVWQGILVTNLYWLTLYISDYVLIRRSHINHFCGIIADLTDRCPSHQSNLFRRLSQHLFASLSCGVSFVFQDIPRMSGPISRTAPFRAENCSKTLTMIFMKMLSFIWPQLLFFSRVLSYCFSGKYFSIRQSKTS